jgi:hypothetical protein
MRLPRVLHVVDNAEGERHDSAATTLFLGPGEVAEPDTRVPRWLGSAGDHPVEIVSLVGRRCERIHVRAAPRRTCDSS